MKHIKHILLSSVILLLSAGCTKEELPKVVTAPPGITIDLRIADPLSNEETDPETTLLRSLDGKINGRIITRATSLTSLECEKKISNAYVLFYTQNAAADALPAAFQAVKNPDPSTGHRFNLDYSLLTQLIPGTKYDIYVLANLPASTTAPSSATTKSELLALQERQFERTLENPGISFVGTNSFTYNKRNGTTIYIDISRTVARLDILLTGLTLQTGQTVSVRVINQATTVPYFNTTHAVPTSDSYFASTAIKNTDDIYRTYIYPNYTSGDNPQNASIRIIVSNSDGSVARMWICKTSEIIRNKIYEITCTF